MTKLKVVLDTNVYLSAIIFGGNSRHILDLIIKKKVIAYISPSILFEISQKLEKKFKWNQDQILLAIRTLSRTARVAKPRLALDIVKSDRNDNKIIEAAIEGRVDFVITGDKHLLGIKTYQKVKIVSPVQFLSIYLNK